MIQPVFQDQDFIADVKQAGREVNQLHLWWLGQSGFLLSWRSQHLLLDPYLSDSLTAKYADSNTPHERMTAKVIDPQQLDFIDIVTSSHNHTDHLDGESIKPLLTVIVCFYFLVSGGYSIKRKFADFP